MKKDRLTVWYLMFFTVIFFTSFFFSAYFYQICWEGYNVDEEQLAELCKVSVSKYWQIRAENQTFCPEGIKTVTNIKGCEPDWFAMSSTVLLSILAFSIAWVTVTYIHK